MYGVPKDLPLQRFVGDSICQIAFGSNGIHFNFNKAGSINVDFGKWQIHDSSGTIVDESLDDDALPSTRQQYRVHVILDSDVTKFQIDAPHSFSLVFSSGHRLTIYDDSPQYESFSIQPDGIIV
jgi:hypothetical protein